MYIYNNNSINNITTIAIQSTFVSRTMPKGITNLLDFSVGIFSNWNRNRKCGSKQIEIPRENSLKFSFVLQKENKRKSWKRQIIEF